jgi:hypothetical protein
MSTHDKTHFGPVRRISKPTPWQIPRGNWLMKKEDQEAARRALVEHLQEQQAPQPLPQVVEAKPNVERTRRKRITMRVQLPH